MAQLSDGPTAEDSVDSDVVDSGGVVSLEPEPEPEQPAEPGEPAEEPAEPGEPAEEPAEPAEPSEPPAKPETRPYLW
jgi:hypothetical protein